MPSKVALLHFNGLVKVIYFVVWSISSIKRYNISDTLQTIKKASIKSVIIEPLRAA